MTRPDNAERITELSAARRKLLAQWSGDDDQATTPVSVEERLLVEIWREVLRTDRIRPTDNFLQLGGDSITSLQVVARANSRGLRLTSRQVIEAADLQTLARSATSAAANPNIHDVATGPVPLTPVQRWFFEQEIPDSHYWDQAVVVEVHRDVDTDILRHALRDVLDHHDALRSRFACQDGRWTQKVPAEAPTAEVIVVDNGSLEDAIAHAQRCIDLTDGRLVAAALIRGCDGPPRLLLAVHHLVVDGVSLRILIEDLQTAYCARAAGDVPKLPPKTASMRSWATSLHRYAASPYITDQLNYWRSVPAAEAAALPTDHAGATDTMATCASITASLDAECTNRLVQQVPRISGVQAQHVLLASLLIAWAGRTGRRELQIDLEGHGREPIDDTSDVSRTVGWFTSIYPVRLELHGPAVAVLDRVRRHLDTIPDRGIGYGLLRYLTPAGDGGLAALPQSQMSFNYLGRFDQPVGANSVFGVPVEVPTVLQSDRATRRYALEIVATVSVDRLMVEWRYNRLAFEEATIRGLVDAQLAAVTELVTELSQPTPNPSEFPLSRLAPQQLSAVRRQLRGDGA
ncbi:condensation domain-containing protein [Micromonospora sp. NPDC049051]|uniref:condensation domain-containing protein n=1 Tax=Micromonospora sp. NPDC049051 TaxID=3364264 RepID=UPI00371AA595